MISIFREASQSTLAEIAEELRVRKTSKFILLFSMGSQFDHLIVQQLAKLGVYCLVADPGAVKAVDVQKAAPAGIILSGGPGSAHNEPPPFDAKIFDLGIPVLGVCLGFQMWAKHVGAKVLPGQEREFGTHALSLKGKDPLFVGIARKTPVLQSHGDKIHAHKKITLLGSTKHAPVSAGRYKHLWGVQFHPEVTESEEGPKLFANFCFEICGITDPYPAHNVAKQKIEALEHEIGDKKVLIALSGGSDSSVVAYLLKHAMTAPTISSKDLSSKDRPWTNERSPRAVLGQSGPRLRGIYIKGIDRPDDEAYVRKYFGSQKWIDVQIVDATDRFLEVLAGKTRMRDKRVAMRHVYTEVLEHEIEKFGAQFIAQGTLYTDLRESGHGHQTGARIAEIKVHHNTGISFSVPELSPLADCVKDSARDIGRDIGVPEDLLLRHPFPGPGLVVRIEGEVTREMLAIARKVDGIYVEELRKAKLYRSVWQAGATVTRSEHTVTKGDDAGMGHVVALWAVWSVNGFTARFAQLPYEFLETVSRRITNEVREVGAVVYRITDKPPATIEWG